MEVNTAIHRLSGAKKSSLKVFQLKMDEAYQLQNSDSRTQTTKPLEITQISRKGAEKHLVKTMKSTTR